MVNDFALESGRKMFVIYDSPGVAKVVIIFQGQTTSFTIQYWFRKIKHVCTLLGHAFGRSLRLFCKSYMISARDLDGKCWEGVNQDFGWSRL